MAEQASSQPLEDAINAQEAREQSAFIARALGTDNQAEQDQILVEALLRFGGRFLQGLNYCVSLVSEDSKTRCEELNERALDLFLRWLAGEKLTDREDERERRAAAALHALGVGGSGMARLAVEALLGLPEGHPKRNLSAIRARIEERIEQSRHDAEWEEVFLLAKTLIRSQLLSEPETAALISSLSSNQVDAEPADKDNVQSARVSFLRAAAMDYLLRSISAREAGLESGAYIGKMRSLIDEARPFGSSFKDDFALALALEEANESEQAAEVLARIVDNQGEMCEEAAWIEGMIRVRLGHWARAIDVLAPIIDKEESDYLLALEDSDVISAGERFNKDAVNLALAYAFADRWSEALSTVDRVKSPRLRHAQRLRQTPEGKKLLRLEAALASTRRGVPQNRGDAVDRELDPLGARISRQAQLLEEYRTKRPDLATASLAQPGLAELSGVLEDGEALVCMGSGFRGLLIGVIVGGDRVKPSGQMLIEELTQAGVTSLFTDGKELGGWALELAALEPVDPERALIAMLDAVDRAFGERIAAFVRARSIRKVTFVPHRMLHLIPFWALPSLVDLEVGVASSAVQWYEARKVVPEVHARLAAIGNPTLDLGLARVEAAVVARLLKARGCEAELLLDGNAKEGAIRAAVRRAGLFHFAGHGIAKPMQPLLSSLLTHPDESWGWPDTGDPLVKLAQGAASWVSDDGGRHSDLPQGRLVEHWDDEGRAVERLLEHADHGTLYGRYQDDRLLQLAELWTTADILVEDTFSNCALAFLGACQAGQAALRADIDEGLGLPGALQIAGVNSVISALWPVDDAAALVFARLFYGRLAAATTDTHVDVEDVLRACRRELASLSTDSAQRKLAEIREQTEHKPSRARLDLAIADLAAKPDPPFAHPYHWAAYFCLGAEKLSLGWRSWRAGQA